MSKVSFSKCRFTIASLLFVAANQLGCGQATDPQMGMQSALSVQITGTDYGAVKSDPAGIDCGATCSAAFASGTSVTLTATANSAGSFVGWGGSCQGSAPTCTVTVSASTLATAQFVAIGTPLAALTVQKSGAGTGAVTSEPSGITCGAQCERDFTVGSVVTLTATPDAGNSFAGWSGACTGMATTCQVTMAAAQQVTAQFNGPPPAVAGIAPFYAAKAGGTVVTITGSGFQSGSQVTIGGIAATSVTFVSATQLQATVPAGTQAGCAAVRVTNPDSQQVSIASAMAYQPTAVSFASATASPALAANPTVVRSGDFNQDGKSDLLVAGASGKVQFLAGDGTGVFAAPSEAFSEVSFSGLEIADFDKDGKLDALALSNGSDQVFVLLGNGDGTFTQKYMYATGATPRGLSILDLNGNYARTYPDVQQLHDRSRESQCASRPVSC